MKYILLRDFLPFFASARKDAFCYLLLSPLYFRVWFNTCHLVLLVCFLPLHDESSSHTLKTEAILCRRLFFFLHKITFSLPFTFFSEGRQEWKWNNFIECVGRCYIFMSSRDEKHCEQKIKICAVDWQQHRHTTKQKKKKNVSNLSKESFYNCYSIHISAIKRAGEPQLKTRFTIAVAVLFSWIFLKFKCVITF